MNGVLLDEMLPAPLAECLAKSGLPAEAVVANPLLLAASDDTLCDHAVKHQQALVTINIRDFAPILEERAGAGMRSPAMWFISTRTFTGGPAGMAQVCSALLQARDRKVWPVPGTAMFLPRADDR